MAEIESESPFSPVPVLGSAGTTWSPETRLYSDGVVKAHDGGPVIVPPHSTLRRIPGTCFLDPTSGSLPRAHTPTGEEISAARRRLSGSPISGGQRYRDMAEVALLDIEAVTFPNGATVAAASPYWFYVWPRDASYLAVALTQCNRCREAQRILTYVASMQEQDGTWQARYLPDGSRRVPDDRGTQLDGNGWFLWAVWVLARLGGAVEIENHLVSAARKATEAAIAAIDHESGLPRPSQDFWEMDIHEPTLGVAAPLLLALRTGSDLMQSHGDTDLAARASGAARALAATIARKFGPRGYPRRLGGAGPDASICFLLPPFAPARMDVVAAWRQASADMRVSNGGLRPGTEWEERTTAWTPQTSLFAVTAAYVGDRREAEALLDWLNARRTRLGSLPEKVTAAGDPAAVAPLPLTGAAVLIALAALDNNSLPVPQHGSETD